MKKYLRVGILVLVAALVIGGITSYVMILRHRGYEQTYAKAVAASRNANYIEALKLFKSADGKDGKKTKNFYVEYAKVAYYLNDKELAKSMARKAKTTYALDDKSSVSALNITISDILGDTLPQQVNSGASTTPVKPDQVDGLISG